MNSGSWYAVLDDVGFFMSQLKSDQEPSGSGSGFGADDGHRSLRNLFMIVYKTSCSSSSDT